MYIPQHFYPEGNEVGELDGKKVKGLRSTNWYLQNGNGHLKHSTRNTVYIV